MMGSVVFGQDPDEESNLDFLNPDIPIAPTAAALAKYGFAPLDLSSGQINFSVPIHIIKGQSISLPINFSYRPGVRIKETSPYTGHGWSMLAGGVITRTVQGAVDPTPRVEKSILQNEWSASDAALVSQKKLDASPDVFNYNFMGYTGQFALQDDFETPYYIKEQRNWLFDIDRNGLNFGDKITIVTEDGTIYVFGAVETTTIDDENNYFGDDVPVAWHLTEVISATTDEKIELSYYQENFGKPILKINTLVLNPYNQTSYVLPTPDIHVSFKSKKLDEITLYKDNVAVSKVTFEANTTRYDITSTGAYTAKALSKISVFDDPDSSTPLKYFDIDIENVDAVGNVNNERLFLRSIQEFFGDGSTSNPPYNFEYISEDKLPSRLAYKADHWGYYSKENGTEFPYSDQVSWRTAKSKEPSYTAKYGSLKKVVFPTGGYNIFNYENNQYSKKEYQDKNGNEWYGVSKELKLNWRGDAAGGGGWFNYGNYEYSNTETYDFSLEKDQFVKLDINLNLRKGLNTSIWDLATKEIKDFDDHPNKEKQYQISVIDTDTNEEVFIAYLNSIAGDDEITYYVTANKWVELVDNNLYGNPNDVPGSLRDLYLEYYQGYVLKNLYKHSNNKTPYKTYSFSSLSNNNDIIIGGTLDRPFYLDLDKGNYQVLLKTNTVDNDMINYSSEVGMKINYRVSNETFNSIDNSGDNDLIIDDIARLGGGIRIKSQVIGTEHNELVKYYDYVIHDEKGYSTSQSSAQITEEPNIIEYTPDAYFVTYNPDCTTIGGSTGCVYRSNRSYLGPSPLWARVGGDHPAWYPGPAPLLNRESYIKLNSDLYSIKSEPYQLDDSWITYSEVKVINGEEHANTGFKIHKFHASSDGTYRNFYDTFAKHDDSVTLSGFNKYGGSNLLFNKGWPYNGLLEKDARDSKLKSILEYRFNGPLNKPTLIKEEHYSYKIFNKESFSTSQSQRVFNVHFIGTTFFKRQYCLLGSKKTFTYDLEGENPLMTKVDYEYNNPNHNLLTKVFTSDSKGNEIIKRTKYTRDYLSSISTGPGSSITMETLNNANILVPIEEQIWKGNATNGYKLISGTLKVYDMISSSAASNNKLYRPIEYLNLEKGSLENNGQILEDFNNSTGFRSVNWRNGTANYYNYETDVNLDYYSNGNLKKVTKRNSLKTYYVWGYNQTQIISKIENYTSINSSQQSAIDDAVSESNNDDDRCLNSETCNEKTLRNKLTLLRNAFPDAHVTTFTHDPLIGVTSITDPRGNITYYEFNDLNYLDKVKDTDEKILLSNEYYYYKGQ